MLSQNETGLKVALKEEDDKLVVTQKVSKEDLAKFLSRNKAEQNTIPQKQYKSLLRKKHIWKAASIPVVVIMQWKKEGIDVFKDEDWPKVQAKLNSPEFKYLRTSPGKV